MSLARRAQMRPVLYPAAILVAFVLNFLVETGVSPYAAGRPLVVAVLLGLALPWLAGLVTGARDRAGLVALLMILLLLGAQAPLIVALVFAALLLLAVQQALARRRADRKGGAYLWPLVTRALTAGALILIVAVGIKAAQMGRVEIGLHDLAAEFPLRPDSAVAAPSADLPNLYVLLLDGYPRGDKLMSEFGVDNGDFVTGLRGRGFTVASHSRSNQTITYETLVQMFDYAAAGTPLVGSSGSERVLLRHRINEGEFVQDIRGLGYRVIGISPAFEHVALRQADVFIDTGQLNEFEWVLVEMTGLRLLVDSLAPSLTADLHRSRVLAEYDAFENAAIARSHEPQFVFMHVISPHAPQAFDRDGSALPLSGAKLPYNDPEQIADLGWTAYSRQLGAQIAFIDARTLRAVDRIIETDPDAVIVVFSDHGSGARWSETDPSVSDVDLRTANLLAVRSPGKPGIIDDRSTLVNVLPRLLRAYAGIGPADVPETIWAWANDPKLMRIFKRPD